MKVSEQLEAALEYLRVGGSTSPDPAAVSIARQKLRRAIPEIKAMKARLERLETAAQGVMDSYEAHCAVRDPKPEAQWDEYDTMIIPAWRELSAALAGQPPEGETDA